MFPVSSPGLRLVGGGTYPAMLSRSYVIFACPDLVT